MHNSSWHLDVENLEAGVPIQVQRGLTAIIKQQKYMTPIQEHCPSGELLAAMLMLTAKYLTRVMPGTTDPGKMTE